MAETEQKTNEVQEPTQDEGQATEGTEAQEPQEDEKHHIETPPVEDVEEELERVRRRNKFLRILARTTLFMFAVIAGTALIAILVLPIVHIDGDSMKDTLEDRDTILVVRGVKPARGDIVSYTYNNEVLVGRVVALPGEWIDIDADGTVSIDDVELDEPYVTNKMRGNCDISLPYQVPEGRYFVLSDQRSFNKDSRSSAIGCVTDDMLVGKLFFRIAPVNHFGFV